MRKYETTYPTPDTVKELSLERLVDIWEMTSDLRNTEAPIVRGWLMDELERRNPEGFNAWLDLDTPEDKDLRRYIFQFPTLTKENAKVGQYYAFAGGYTIVQRIYRISEEYARENELCYLDRVTTTTGDFALPGSDIISGIRP